MKARIAGLQLTPKLVAIQATHFSYTGSNTNKIQTIAFHLISNS